VDTAKKHHQEWGLTLLDGLSYAAQLPNVDDRKKMGVVGTNLGGVLGVALATFDKRIGAVVQHSGVVPDELKDKLDNLPPVLLLHGAKNKFVPLDRVRKAEKLLAGRKTPHEVHVYPEQTHAFRGPSARDALDRTIAFLKKHLK
jgi:dienelactone hydrolase